MQLAPARNLEAFRGVGFLHPERDVCVQLPEQSVPDVTAGDIFSFLPCHGRIIYHKLHGNGGLTDLLEGDGNHMIGRAEGVADPDIADA